MSRSVENTTIGGGNEEFLTTQWSQILRVGTTDREKSRLVLESIALRYWKPVYCYIRRKGHPSDRAKDLTQGFFCDVVFDSSLLKRADKSKGRFRKFLLSAIECYLADEHRKKTSKRRSPRGVLASLDSDDAPDLPATAAGLDPSETFNYAWATQILDEALAQVEQQCVNADKEVHWRLFQEKVLQPIMNGGSGPSFGDLCSRYGIRDEQTASNMVITVKRCFRRVLDDLLRRHVSKDSDVEDEYRDLFRHSRRNGAG
jgi:DNA-directed RNA polymerase specialized sigma24 family protein